jgi:hypothetical protein
MTITLQIAPDIEMQMREKIAYGDKDAVRHLLLKVLDPAVEALLVNGNEVSELPEDEFEALADKLADEFMAYVGQNCKPLSDYAVSREGIYEI